jgi:hypothetical protein
MSEGEGLVGLLGFRLSQESARIGGISRLFVADLLLCLISFLEMSWHW